MKMPSILLLSGLVACGGDDGPVETRACNLSDRDFASFELEPGVDLGPLAINACSPYAVADVAVYRYTYVKFMVGADEFSIIPVDYVGETPLASGRWSYRVTITDYATRRAAVDAIPD